MADDDHNTTDSRHKPFVLASVRSGTVDEAVAAVSEALAAAGFTVAGVYRATPQSAVVVITNAALQQFAAQSERGGFGAVLRVGITQAAGGSVQVSYTNPRYMAYAYCMAGDNAALSEQLAKILGSEKEYGSVKGLTEKKLRKYQYKIGMEYFNETETLHKLKTYEETVAACDAALSAQSDIVKVCRVDIPGKKETLFCCGLQSKDKYANDAFIMGKIDGGDMKHTPHMPYEVLVSEYKVVMLHARFRIAINFPDLTMMGEGSFMDIMDTPKAIKKALTAAVGGKD